VETTGLYWHFVDLVWMFVVPLVYLTNIAPWTRSAPKETNDGCIGKIRKT